ncbi:MAG: hypothetical protein ACXWOW_10535 [Candidatus Limnocylindrales bacterium]
MSPRLATLCLVVVGLLAAASALAIVQPFAAGSVSFDGGSSVLHFMRLIDGRHLESFISTTPKPLLTVVYGLVYGLTHDWRAISLATIGAYAVSLALATWLAARLAGRVAAAFVAVALIGSPGIAGELVIASAVPWALLGWTVAGLAATAPRPRYALAGVALALASLARLEGLIVVGAAAGALIVGWLVGRRDTRVRVPRGAWWLLVGFAAVPVMLVHDWLLTGDPLFWASVAIRYSEAVGVSRIMRPVTLARVLAHRYLDLVGFAIFAVIGGLSLLQRRRWAAAVGLAALGPGIVAFLFFLSVRGTFVATRYAVPVDLAVLFAAGIGVARTAEGLARLATRRWPRPDAGLPRSTAWRLTGAVVASAALALAFGWPPAILDSTTTAAASGARQLATDERAAVPVLEAALARLPGTNDLVAAAGQRPLVLVVPVPMRTLLAADLGVPLTRLGSTSAALLSASPGLLGKTDLVVHSRAGDAPDPAYAALEVATQATVGGQTLTPLLVDATNGLWIYAVAGG